MLLNYCLTHVEDKKIWFVDALQVFDPYYLSRRNIPRTRQLLHKLNIARPFTFYQLRDKLYSFTKIKLNKKSVMMVSGFDSFDDSIANEKQVVLKRMLTLLARLAVQCVLIISITDPTLLENIMQYFNEVKLWEEPLPQ